MEKNKEELKPMCNCECHSKSAGEIMHFMPCCDRTYEKYNE